MASGFDGFIIGLGMFMDDRSIVDQLLALRAS